MVTNIKTIVFIFKENGSLCKITKRTVLDKLIPVVEDMNSETCLVGILLEQPYTDLSFQNKGASALKGKPSEMKSFLFA